MRGSPRFLAWRLSRKARLTAGGIALCVAFAVLSFTVVSGLRGTTYNVSEQFETREWMVSDPSFRPFDPVARGLREGTYVLLTEAQLASGENVTLVAFQARDLTPVPPGTIQPGAGLALRGNVSIVSPSAATLRVGTTFDANFSQPYWAVVAPATMRAIDTGFGRYDVTYVLVPRLDEDERARLEREGLIVRPVPAIIPFFESGATEVVRDLWLVVVFSSVLVAILAFEFMHMETRARRREIGIWRAVGMRGGGVLAILLGQAGLIALIGIAAGSGASLALVYVARQATGLAILDPRPDLVLLGGVAGSILLATLVGAYLPAARASRELVREALEGAR